MTSDLSSGDGSSIRIRPINTQCASGLVAGQEASILISRPAPTLTITGQQTTICSGSTDFTINGMPSGSSVIWSLDNTTDASIIGANNQNTVTVQRTGTANAIVMLTATVTHCTFSYKIIQNIVLGAIPVTEIGINLPFADPNNLECNTIYKAERVVPQQYRPTAYQWTINPEWTIITNPSNASINFAPNSNASADGYLGLSVRNACDWSAEQVLFMHVSCSNVYSMAVSPNPATDDIVATIQPKNKGVEQQDKNVANIEFLLYDVFTSQVVKKWSVQNGQKQYRLKASGIKTGQYVLQATIGQSKTSLKIIIK